jgi:hypothetical protein
VSWLLSSDGFVTVTVAAVTPDDAGTRATIVFGSVTTTSVPSAPPNVTTAPGAA